MDLSGVSFLSGFAAGVGIGLFVSRFDAACDKKQEADTDTIFRLVFAVEVLPSDWAEGVFSEVAAVVHRGGNIPPAVNPRARLSWPAAVVRHGGNICAYFFCLRFVRCALK